MFKNPKTNYEKGYNNGFKAHENYVAEGQIKRIENRCKAMYEQTEKELAERERELQEKIDDYDSFDLFRQFIQSIK